MGYSGDNNLGGQFGNLGFEQLVVVGHLDISLFDFNHFVVKLAALLDRGFDSLLVLG